MHIEGFLQLPSVDQIKKKPTEPYPYPTSGRIHADKFQFIVDFLTSDSLRELKALKQEFEGHSIFNSIENLSHSELADYCRHILIANKSHIAWEIVDHLMGRLDRHFTPYWNLPSFEFNKGFNQIFSQFLRWDTEFGVGEILIDLVNKHNFSFTEASDVNAKLTSKIKTWTFTELWNLYDELIEFFDNQAEYNAKYDIIITSLSQIFLEMISDRKLPINQKIALVLLFVKAYSKLSKETVKKSEEMLDRVWRDVEKLDEEVIASYRYIFGAGYAFIAKRLFETSTDFISRRRLLAGILSNFVNPESFRLVDWLKLTKNYELHNSVYIYIIEGYNDLLEILKQHHSEFPEGETKDEIKNTMEAISNGLFDISFYFMKKKFGLEFDYNIRLDRFVQALINNKEFHLINHNIEKVIIKLIQYQIAFKNFEADEIELYFLFAKELASKVYSNQESLLFDLDTLLSLNTYDFTSIYDKIHEEIKVSSSIILSSVFENEIISKISSAMDYLLKNSVITGRILIESYEIILYFASEWLQYIYNKDILYGEALMVIAPIISICFVQISKGYFERNLTEKAFLTYLNMHYFVELFIDEIKRSSTWKSSGDGGGADRDDITNRFNQLIKDWNLKEILSIGRIKDVVVDMELSLSKLSMGSGSSSLSGMLEDDLIFGFMDLTGHLEEFITLDIGTHKDVSIIDQLLGSSLYKPSKMSIFNRNDRIGFISNSTNQKELPFPLIRNVHEMAMALKMFPIELSLQTFSDESNLYKSFTEIFKQIDSDEE